MTYLGGVEISFMVIFREVELHLQRRQHHARQAGRLLLDRGQAPSGPHPYTWFLYKFTFLQIHSKLTAFC